jgi:hypothetical protein
VKGAEIPVRLRRNTGEIEEKYVTAIPVHSIGYARETFRDFS